jgi:hypothetical protein
MRIWKRHMGAPAPIPGPTITQADLDEGVLWPWPPEWIVRFSPERSPYLIDVEMAMDSDGMVFVTGYGIRSGVPTSTSGTKLDPWMEGAEVEPVSPRDVQRISLSRFARAALALASDPLAPQGRQEAERLLMPRGLPSNGVGAEFYQELLQTARRLERQGVAPVAEIARRKRVDANVVHQWLHRARKLDSGG